ncbi:MAG: MBL fold metallo-hydrolase [Dehalococcoidia bacterium]
MADWTVTDLGEGVHIFGWLAGFYFCPFLVTPDGVLAVDPVDERAAANYREAIASVTSAPIRTIVYSHEHKDHIAGAASLAPDAEIVAHTLAGNRIAVRRDPVILPPTRLTDGDETLALGGRAVELRYFGPNHSDSNLAILFSTGRGRLLYYCDVVEPGFAPYRNMPDTDLEGLLRSLEAADGLGVSLVAGGHGMPGDPAWIGRTRRYLLDLLEAVEAAYRSGGGQAPLPGEDGVSMTERVRRGVCQRAADSVRDRYGNWTGFDLWAPMTADRLLSYVITGN